MTFIGWIQILLYCAIIVAITPVLGAYMTRVFGGERPFLSPILRPVELAIYRIAGVNERQEQHAVTYTVGMLIFHLGGLFILRADAAAGIPAVQSSRAVRRLRRPVVQYRGQFHHQHQLAELRWREHAFVPRADAWADAPELSVSCHRNRTCDRAYSRLCKAFGAHRRQFLGRCYALHALHSSPDLHSVRSVSGLAGHPADARPLH